MIVVANNLLVEEKTLLNGNKWLQQLLAQLNGQFCMTEMNLWGWQITNNLKFQIKPTMYKTLLKNEVNSKNYYHWIIIKKKMKF